MDEEMEETPPLPPSVPIFVCFEVDLDYEFDAPKYFDLSRDESPAETGAAESWFETAGSCAPSPLVARMFTGVDVQMDSTDALLNLQSLEFPKNFSAHPDAAVPRFSEIHDKKNGLILQNSVLHDVTKVDNKSTSKIPFLRGSTLMKPTASQLAKQCLPRQMKGASRCRKQIEIKTGRSFEDPNDYSHQAAKRQRLERGHFCKVVGIKQTVDLFHKVPEKVQKNGLADYNIQPPRAKLTIPREPELQTARRALILRAQQPRSLLEEEPSTSTSTFKARPLNRKILEAPSLPLPQRSTPRLPKFKEFNFRTHDRAIQHGTTAESSAIAPSHIPTLQCDVKGFLRTQCRSSAYQQLQSDGKRAEERNVVPLNFKAQPLNKKIFASKGDIGVFRSAKRELTRPKEFQFSTSKKSQQAPLAELFNKLTLSSELQKTTAMSKFRLPSQVDTKKLHELGNFSVWEQSDFLTNEFRPEIIFTHVPICQFLGILECYRDETKDIGFNW